LSANFPLFQDHRDGLAMKLNLDQTVAVDPEYFWLPMCDCPQLVKVQLLGAGCVATYGNYLRGDSFWHGWAPLPKIHHEE
jgi:hypothetical protein